jgi:metal-responsive CopG/Arc/MetJ family transcriptional regulator
MKTTLELPDALLREVKSVAARRRTTMRSLMEHALRRELGELTSSQKERTTITELNAYGFPVIKRRGHGRLTSETVYALQDEEAGE